MAYVGTPIDTTNQFQSLQGKRFSGNGSTTAFTLDVAPTSTLDIEVFVENVRQDPNSAYTLNGTTMTFAAAPPSGTNNIYVIHQAKAVGTIDIPFQNTAVGPALTIGSGGAEDTKIVFDGNAQDYHIGLDDSTDDLVIGKGSALGTTANIVIDENGHVTKPLQSSFSASYNGSQTDMAVGSNVTLQFGSEVFDTNSDYNNSNYTFTAPVTGKYVLSYFVNLNELDSSATYVWQEIATSNRGYRAEIISNQLADSDMAYYGMNATVIADMDANDTAYVFFKQTGGSATANMDGNSYFMGYLLG